MKKIIFTLLFGILMFGCKTNMPQKEINIIDSNWKSQCGFLHEENCHKNFKKTKNIILNNDNKTLIINVEKDCGSFLELISFRQTENKIIIKIADKGEERCDAGTFWGEFTINFDQAINKNNLEVYYDSKIIYPQ